MKYPGSGGCSGLGSTGGCSGLGSMITGSGTSTGGSFGSGGSATTTSVSDRSGFGLLPQKVSSSPVTIGRSLFGSFHRRQLVVSRPIVFDPAHQAIAASRSESVQLPIAGAKPFDAPDPWTTLNLTIKGQSPNKPSRWLAPHHTVLCSFSARRTTPLSSDACKFRRSGERGSGSDSRRRKEKS